MDSASRDPDVPSEYVANNFADKGRMWSHEQKVKHVTVPTVMASSGMASHGVDSSPVPYQQSPTTTADEQSPLLSYFSRMTLQNGRPIGDSSITDNLSTLATSSSVASNVFGRISRANYHQKQQQQTLIPTATSTMNMTFNAENVANESEFVAPNYYYHEQSGVPSPVVTPLTSAIRPTIFNGGDNFYCTPKYEFNDSSSENRFNSEASMLRSSNNERCPFWSVYQNGQLSGASNVSTTSSNPNAVSGAYSLPYQHQPISYSPVADNNFLRIKSEFASDCSAFFRQQSNFTGPDRNVATSSTNNLIIETEDASDYLTLDRQQSIFTGPDRQMATVSTNSPQYNLAMSNTETGPDYHMAPNNIDKPNMPSVASTSAEGSDPNEFSSSTSNTSTNDDDQPMNMSTIGRENIQNDSNASNYQPNISALTPSRSRLNLNCRGTFPPQRRSTTIAPSASKKTPMFYRINEVYPSIPVASAVEVRASENDDDDIDWLDRQGQRIPKVKMNFPMFRRRFIRYVRRGTPVPPRRRRAPVIEIDDDEDEIIISDHDEMAVDHNEELVNENPPVMMVDDNERSLAEHHSITQSPSVHSLTEASDNASVTESSTNVPPSTTSNESSIVSSVGPSTSASVDGGGGHSIVQHNYGLRSKGNLALGQLTFNSTDGSLLEDFVDLSPIFQSEHDTSLTVEDVMAELPCNAIPHKSKEIGGQQRPYPFLSSYFTFSRNNQPLANHHGSAFTALTSSPQNPLTIEASTSADTSTSWNIENGAVITGGGHFKKKFDQIQARLKRQETRKRTISESNASDEEPKDPDAIRQKIKLLRKEVYQLKKSLMKGKVQTSTKSQGKRGK